MKRLTFHFLLYRRRRKGNRRFRLHLSEGSREELSITCVKMQFSSMMANAFASVSMDFWMPNSSPNDEPTFEMQIQVMQILCCRVQSMKNGTRRSLIKLFIRSYRLAHVSSWWLMWAYTEAYTHRSTIAAIKCEKWWTKKYVLLTWINLIGWMRSSSMCRCDRERMVWVYGYHDICSSHTNAEQH